MKYETLYEVSLISLRKRNEMYLTRHYPSRIKGNVFRRVCLSVCSEGGLYSKMYWDKQKGGPTLSFW